MDVPLGDAASGMSKERRDRQFRKAEIASKAGERVPQRMRRDIFKAGPFTNTIQHADNTDKMTLTPISREEEG
jgi:hypothetical protein